MALCLSVGGDTWAMKFAGESLMDMMFRRQKTGGVSGVTPLGEFGYSQCCLAICGDIPMPFIFPAGFCGKIPAKF